MSTENEGDASNDDASAPTTGLSSRPTQHFAPPLPRETYDYLIHALLSLQHSACRPPTHPCPVHLNPIPNYHYSSQPGAATPSASITGTYSVYPPNPPFPLASSSQLTPSSPTSLTTASLVQDPEGTEDATSISEDKRRRNTAASARFRIKKKLRMHDLERTVADLTGRTEELEREAADLRRENTWLKEIVLLKGRNLAALGSQALAPANRHDEDPNDDRRHAESDPESTVKRRGKGKNRQS